MRKGLLIIISGPSGVGKGTLIEELMKRLPDLTFSVSATTRHPRPGEKEGVHYFFLTRPQFEDWIKNRQFLEWAEVHGDRYGTPKNFVEAKLSQGQDVLLDIDVQGGLQVKKSFPEGVFIFISPPSMGELRRRLTGRHTEKQGEIKRRMSDAKEELEAAGEYQYIITNEDVRRAVDQLEAIIRAERSKKSRRNDALPPD